MFAEFQFEDIIFGIFPKVDGGDDKRVRLLAKNSVRDIERLMQMLEVSFTFHALFCFSLKVKLKALTFIHDLKIAHRVSTLSVDL